MNYRQLLVFPVLALAAFSGSAQVLPTNVDICLLHDTGAGLLRISLRANDNSFGEVISGLSFTVRWPESSPATLSMGSSAWCLAPNSAFGPGPSAMVTPGNGFKYRTWTSIGFEQISYIQDNGGCGQTLLADTWTEVWAIPVNGDPGGTYFEIADDEYVNDQIINRAYYVGLNGEQYNDDGDLIAGTICSLTTGVPVAEVAHGLEVHPNPTTGNVVVNFTDASASDWQMELVDATGRMVERRTVNGGGQSWTRTLDLSGYDAGMYKLVVRSSTATHTRSILLQH